MDLQVLSLSLMLDEYGITGEVANALVKGLSHYLDVKRQNKLHKQALLIKPKKEESLWNTI